MLENTSNASWIVEVYSNITLVNMSNLLSFKLPSMLVHDPVNINLFFLVFCNYFQFNFFISTIINKKLYRITFWSSGQGRRSFDSASHNARVTSVIETLQVLLVKFS